MIKPNAFDIGEVALKKLLILACLSALVACQREEVNQAVVLPQAASAASVPLKPPVIAKVIETAKSVKTTAGVSVGTPAPVALNVAPVATLAVAATTSAQTVPEKLLPTAPPSVTVEAKAPIVMSDADGIALAKKRNCFACHMVDKKVVGPAWKDVAVRYHGDAGAQARLEAKITKGGSGVWGSMAMPAQPQVTADECTLLVRFILNLK
ncbi:MAG: c-type cytochrome [Gallionella sp.]|nr:c-type cytochrome [Gallionella sp.]